MLWNAQNGTVELGEDRMDYVRFGTGDKPLVMLPGVGDGLRTVRGMALPLAALYRSFARGFTVYVFSRRRTLPAEYTTRQMAADQAEAMARLGIENACVVGVSQGGMIAQWLAIDHPEMVHRLVLTVTAPCANALMDQKLGEWMDFARRGDHAGLMRSNLSAIYTPGYVRRAEWLVPAAALVSKPRSYERFYTMAQACLTHNALAELWRIRCPVLVVGGEQDQVLTGQASRDLARYIPRARLKMYPQYGHGLYDEAGDFLRLVMRFFQVKP